MYIVMKKQKFFMGLELKDTHRASKAFENHAEIRMLLYPGSSAPRPQPGGGSLASHSPRLQAGSRSSD